MRIGVLISGRGSNLRALLEAKVSGRLVGAEFAVVISNNPEAKGLDAAREHHVPATAIPHRGYPGGRAAHERAVLKVLREHECEAVVLAGYLRVIGRDLLEAYPNRIINIHPALLPSFPGLDAQRQALDWGVRVSGCTVHFVDEGVDSGPIILQRPVPVREDDTEELLAARILEQEHQAIVDAVEALSRGGLRVEGRRVFGVSMEGDRGA